MRVSVAFHTVTVLVPCGDGECTVGELIEKAIVRFKKCTNKPAEHEIKVKNLRMANGSGYIYNYDTVRDVLDDKELVIADFEDPTSMETSSMASFDSAHNFPGGNANLPAGTTPSLTSADNEEQTPVLDSPRSLWDEAIGNTRRRRWSGSNLTTTDSDARESPSNERLLPPLRSLPPAYPPPTFTRTALSMSPHDTSRRTGYPFPRGRRPDISSYGGRSQYTRSLLDDSPPLEASLERSFGRLPTRYGRIYRHRSHDLLDDPLERTGFLDDPDMDHFTDIPDNYYLSQPPLYSAAQLESFRHQGPSGYSLSQPTGSGRHVSFKDKPSQLGPRERSERPSSLGSGGGANGMRTLREEPGELRSSEDEREQRPEADSRVESDSTMSDCEYDPFNRGSRKSIRDGPVLEQWENAIETRGLPLDDGDSEPTLHSDDMDQFDTFSPDARLAGNHLAVDDDLQVADLLAPEPLPVANGTAHYGHEELGGGEEEEREESDTEELSNIRIIELLKETQPLGLHLRKAFTADGRDAGIFIASMEPGGFADECKNLEINDRILACNGSDFTKMSNDKAVCLFREMEEERLLKIAISRTVDPMRERGAEESVSEGDKGAEGVSASSVLPTAASNTFTNTRQLGRLYSIDLVKGSGGLGFSLTSRDVAANDGERLIYIRSITPGGLAFEDGRLKIGDRLLKVNAEDISGFTRQEVGELLRNAQGRVTLLVSRQEQGGNEDEEEAEKSLDCPVAIGKTVITLNITMADSGPAGLGITVHGRVNTGNPLLSKVSGDAGIYIKSIVPGGAAALDNRLCVNDQLLSINSQSLVGKSNDDALQTLKDALATKTANIQLVIARKSPAAKTALKRTESLCTNDEEESHPTREVGIDVGPSLQSTASSGPSQDSIVSNTTPSVSRRDMKLSQDSLRSDQDLHLSDPLSDHHRHPVAEGHHRGEIPATRSGLNQKQSVIPEGVAYAHSHMPVSPTSSSLSQGSDRGGKPLSSAMSPTHVDGSRPAVMSPLAGDGGIASSLGQPSGRRKALQEPNGSLTRSPTPPNIPSPHTKYGRRGPPFPLLPPPRTGTASNGGAPLANHDDTEGYHSSTIPRMSKPTKPKAVAESRMEGSTLAQCSSEEALEVCSDTEAPNAFQRDGPGRVSIKKGKGAPKSLPNVEVQNAEPKMEEDESSIPDYESSHDDISTQDTGIDMHFYPGSPLNYSKDHHALHHGFPLNQEGRNSLQRAVDRSTFSELTGSGYDLVQDDHVGDPTCMAVPLAVVEEKKKKDKKKKGIFFFKKNKKDAPARSVDDEKVSTGELAVSQHTGKVQLRQKSAAKAMAHQRYSLSVLDGYDDTVRANV